jgi:hypothetical protein
VGPPNPSLNAFPRLKNFLSCCTHNTPVEVRKNIYSMMCRFGMIQ